MNISELERSLRQLRAATWTFIGAREDALFLDPPGAGKSHLAQGIGKQPFSKAIACCTSRRRFARRTGLLDELADAAAAGTRKQFTETLTTVPPLIIDDFLMRKLPLTHPPLRTLQHAAHI
jgi:DNA replication protein DnaC